MSQYKFERPEIIEMLQRCQEDNGSCTQSEFNAMDDTCSSATVVSRFGSWSEAKKEAGISDTGRSYTYSQAEILDMLRRCKDEQGVCTPRTFNAMDDTCSASAVMKRFGTWTAAKKEAGIEDEASSKTGRKREYKDWEILSHLRQARRRNKDEDDEDDEGTVTVRSLQEEDDLVSPSVAVERFGSWSKAKEKAGLGDDRSSNSRPRKYTDEDYLKLLRKCEREHGKVTQRKFNSEDEFPTSGAVRKRFADEDGNNGWSRAKEQAGVDTNNKRWSNEELLEQLRKCAEMHGSCSAAKFASESDFASPETLQRRFGSWSNAKEEAGLKSR